MITEHLFTCLNQHTEAYTVNRAAEDREDLRYFVKLLTSKRFLEGKEIFIPDCGDGEICRMYTEHQPKLVVGCDDDPKFRAHWKEIRSEVSSQSLLLLHESLLDLPYPDQSFDVVLLSHCIEYAEDPTAIIRASIRLLRPGGILCFSVIPKYAPHSCRTEFVTFPYATLLFSEKTRIKYIKQRTHAMEICQSNRYFVTGSDGKAHLANESFLSVRSMNARLREFGNMKRIGTFSVPTKASVFTKIPGLNEICTRRILTVFEKQC